LGRLPRRSLLVVALVLLVAAGAAVVVLLALTGGDGPAAAWRATRQEGVAWHADQRGNFVFAYDHLNSVYVITFEDDDRRRARGPGDLGFPDNMSHDQLVLQEADGAMATYPVPEGFVAALRRMDLADVDDVRQAVWDRYLHEAKAAQARR